MGLLSYFCLSPPQPPMRLLTETALHARLACGRRHPWYITRGTLSGAFSLL